MAMCVKCKKKFRGDGALQRLKEHMSVEHEGYTGSEIADSVEIDAAADPAAPMQPDEVIPPGAEPEPEPSRDRPRRATRQNRELNDKLNELLELQVRHLLGDTIPPDQLETLKRNRAEVRNALVGFEFNFDDRVVKLESGFWRILITILLVIAPFLPTLPELKAKAEAMQRAAAGKAPNAKGPEPAKPAQPAPAPAPQPAPAPKPAPETPLAGVVDEKTAFQ